RSDASAKDRVPIAPFAGRLTARGSRVAGHLHLLALRWPVCLDRRNDFAGHEIDAVDRRSMRHETFTAPKSHVGWVDEIDDVLEFLHHRVRVPGHDLVRGVSALVRESGTTGRDVHRARPRLFAPTRPRRVADI